MSKYVPVDLAGVPFQAVLLDEDETWDPNTMILGGVAIVKILEPNGHTGFQVLVTQDELNIAEQVGMAAIMDQFMGITIEEKMNPEVDP
jgi:hypothetical protein